MLGTHTLVPSGSPRSPCSAMPGFSGLSFLVPGTDGCVPRVMRNPAALSSCNYSRGLTNEASAQGSEPSDLRPHSSRELGQLAPGFRGGGFSSHIDKAQRVHFSWRWSSRFLLAGGSRQVTSPSEQWPHILGLGKGGRRTSPCTWERWRGLAALTVAGECPASPLWAEPRISTCRWQGW